MFDAIERPTVAQCEKNRAEAQLVKEAAADAYHVEVNRSTEKDLREAEQAERRAEERLDAARRYETSERTRREAEQREADLAELDALLAHDPRTPELVETISAHYAASFKLAIMVREMADAEELRARKVADLAGKLGDSRTLKPVTELAIWGAVARRNGERLNELVKKHGLEGKYARHHGGASRALPAVERCITATYMPKSTDRSKLRVDVAEPKGMVATLRERLGA